MEHPLFLIHGQDPLILQDDETVEDLQNGGMRLLQRQSGFRFGTDSVLLAAYAASFYPHPTQRPVYAADLGAGCGAVSLLLAARLPRLKICAIEVDRPSCTTLARNIALNGLADRMAALNLDICRLSAGSWPFSDAPPGPFASLERGRFDLVVTNPPYLRREQSIRKIANSSVITSPSGRYEQDETGLGLDQLLQAANRLLRPGGRLVLVHRAHRLADVLVSLRAWDLEPRTLRMVQPLPERRPFIFLLSAAKQGRPGGFQVEPPLLVSDRPGHLSKETAAWYGHEPLLSQERLFQGLMVCHDPAGQDWR